jgi:hypothetical protein
MSKSLKRYRPGIILILAFTITTSPAALLAQTAKPAAQAPAVAPPDGGWPRFYNLKDNASVVIYQPQVASWEDQKHIVGLAAVAYQTKDGSKPAVGTVKIESDTMVAVDKRLVNFKPFKITEFNFPTLTRDQSRDLAAELQATIPDGDKVISLDRVLAGLDRSQIMPKAADAAGIKADPPKIFYSATPAIIVNFDGEPVWSPIENNDLKFAVNTNWDVFQSTSTKTIYMRDTASWLKASDVKGPWSPAGTLPQGFSSLPANDNWKEVKASIPGHPLTAATLPKVFVSLEPAELIYTFGEPRYTPVTGTSLLWVNNTESDIFRAGTTGPFYYLVAGRWFSAADLNGPWTFATTSLPEDFKKIPRDHARSRVLASVPGTNEAAEAVLLASVPQTARVNRKETKAPEVQYLGGKPEFKPIEGTSLERAVNTDKDIIKVGDIYYMCFQGVWFMSKAATGPWEVASSVPQSIYTIPASSPSNNVTYVKVEESDDDWVTYAAYAGYTGMMVAWGCTVWGTGWYYPPYYWYGGYYPGYYWYPATYGAAAWYNPYTGTFGRGAAVYGPYGGAGGWAAYNPGTGTYARGGAVYGPYGGSRSFAQAYNPRTGTYGQTRQGSSVYGNWGSSYVQRGDNWAQTGHVTNAGTGRTTSGVRTSEGGGALHTKGQGGSSTIARTGSGDVYAGHDGNAYRKTDSGWQKYGDGGWSNVEKPQRGSGTATPADRQSGQRTGERGGSSGSGVIDQLNHDYGSRAQGQQRVRDNQSYSRSMGGRQSAGSYRSSGRSYGGGGFRGGGGRR